MERTGEENEERTKEQNERSSSPTTTGTGDEFTFYLQFTKPLVLELLEPEERAIAAAWVRKLETGTPEDEELRTNYLKLLLFVLQRGRLSGIFSKQPPAGPLQNFPAGFTVFDMGNLILDQEDMQSFGAGDARALNYEVDVSNNLREYVAGQEIPNFGIQMYYAWSADDPVHMWSFFDEEKFPPFVKEKIKILKEIQADEKAVSTESPKERSGSSAKKKECEFSFLDKLSKKKVKSPQEIESAQGRSFHTYMGLVGRMGNFNPKCDEDVERCVRPPQQSRAKCPRRVRRSNQGECEDDQNFQNFAPGTSEGLNAQNRPCLCPYPCHHISCPEHRFGRGGGGPPDGAAPSTRSPCPGEEADNEYFGSSQGSSARKVSPDKNAGRKTRGGYNYDQAPGPSGCPQPLTMGQEIAPRSPQSSIPTPACPSTSSSRRTPSPGPMANLHVPSPGQTPPCAPPASTPEQRGCSGGTDYCTCPCPRLPTSVGPSIGPTSSTGAMGGRSGGQVSTRSPEAFCPVNRTPEGPYCPPGPGPMNVTPQGYACPGPSNRQMDVYPTTGQTTKFESFYPPITSTRTVDIFPPTDGSRTVDICPSGPNFRTMATYRTPENACPSQPNFVRPQIIIDSYDSQPDANVTQIARRGGNECPGGSAQQQYVTAEDPCFDEPSPDESRRDQRLAMLAAARQTNSPLPGQKVLFEKSSSPESGVSPMSNPPQEGFTDPRFLCPADFGIDGDEGPAASRIAGLLTAPRKQPPTSPNLECPPNTPRSPGYTPIKQWARKWDQLEPIGEVHVYPQPFTDVPYRNCPIGRTVTLNQSNANDISKACATQNETALAMPAATQVIAKTQAVKAPQCAEQVKQQIVDSLPPVSRSQLEVDRNFDFTTYGGGANTLKPNVYYTPQQKKKHGGVLHSPFSWGYETSLNSSRDIASQPDRTYLGVGPFQPFKRPTQAQPLPSFPLPRHCINYDALKKQKEEGMSLWYGVCAEDEELGLARAEDQDACQSWDVERNADGSQFTNDLADKAIAETRRQMIPPREASPAPPGSRGTEREILCSTPIQKNFNPMGFDDANVSSMTSDTTPPSLLRYMENPPPSGPRSFRREQTPLRVSSKKSHNAFDEAPSIPRHQEPATSTTGRRSTRREQLLCSNPVKKSYHTLPINESYVHPMEISEMGVPMGQSYVISRNDDNCPSPYNAQAEMQAQSRSPANRNQCYYAPGGSSQRNN